MFAIIHYIDNQYFQICLDFNHFDGHSDCLIFKKYIYLFTENMNTRHF